MPSAPSIRPRCSPLGKGPDDVVIPVVGECDDGEMADSRTVAAGDVEHALEELGTEVAEGSVGAGTGMVCFDFPGGIGTASRTVGDHHVGVLLNCNFGYREYLDLLGSRLDPAPGARPPTKARASRCAGRTRRFPPLALRRLALRPLLGLARAGSFASEGSGEIGLAFRHRLRRPRRPASSTRTSPPPTRRPTRRSTTASWRLGRPSDSTAACRTRSRPRR